MDLADMPMCGKFVMNWWCCMGWHVYLALWLSSDLNDCCQWRVAVAHQTASL